MLAAWTLIDKRIELEADQIHPSWEVNLQRTELPNSDPVFEPHWKPKVQQAGWTRVDPAAAQTKGCTNFGHRVGEKLWKVESLAVPSGRDEADYVHISGGPFNEAEQQKAAAPNNQ